MPGTTRRVIVLTAWAVYVKPDLSTLVVDLGLTGLPNVVGIDTVRIVIPRLKVPLIFKSRPHAPQPRSLLKKARSLWRVCRLRGLVRRVRPAVAAGHPDGRGAGAAGAARLFGPGDRRGGPVRCAVEGGLRAGGR